LISLLSALLGWQLASGADFVDPELLHLELHGFARYANSGANAAVRAHQRISNCIVVNCRSELLKLKYRCHVRQSFRNREVNFIRSYMQDKGQSRIVRPPGITMSSDGTLIKFATTSAALQNALASIVLACRWKFLVSRLENPQIHTVNVRGKWMTIRS
jgi:hypothetical protein